MFEKYSIPPGVLIERVGDDVLVVVPGANDLVKLSGAAADVLLSVQEGRTVPGSERALADLEQLGVLISSGVSRRGLIKAGAIAAGAGIAVLAMPTAAMAASSDGVRVELVRAGFDDEGSFNPLFLALEGDTNRTPQPELVEGSSSATTNPPNVVRGFKFGGTNDNSFAFYLETSVSNVDVLSVTFVFTYGGIKYIGSFTKT